MILLACGLSLAWLPSWAAVWDAWAPILLVAFAVGLATRAVWISFQMDRIYRRRMAQLDAYLVSPEEPHEEPISDPDPDPYRSRSDARPADPRVGGGAHGRQ